MPGLTLVPIFPLPRCQWRLNSRARSAACLLASLWSPVRQLQQGQQHGRHARPAGSSRACGLSGSPSLQVTGSLFECNIFVASLSCKQSHVLSCLLSHLRSDYLNIICDVEVLIWLCREEPGCGGTFNWLPAERVSTSVECRVLCSLPLKELPFSRLINVLWLLNYSSTLYWCWVPSWSEYKWRAFTCIFRDFGKCSDLWLWSILLSGIYVCTNLFQINLLLR